MTLQPRIDPPVHVGRNFRSARRRQAAARQARPTLDVLGQRELRVLSEIARGKKYKVIGWELGISRRTVEKVREVICEKLGVATTREAVALLLGDEA